MCNDPAWESTSYDEETLDSSISRKSFLGNTQHVKETFTARSILPWAAQLLCLSNGVKRVQPNFHSSLFERLNLESCHIAQALITIVLTGVRGLIPQPRPCIRVDVEIIVCSLIISPIPIRVRCRRQVYRSFWAARFCTPPFWNFPAPPDQWPWDGFFVTWWIFRGMLKFWLGNFPLWHSFAPTLESFRTGYYCDPRSFLW